MTKTLPIVGKRSCWPKVIAGAAALLAVFFISSYVVLSGDESPQNFDDLLITREHAPCLENAYHSLAKILAQDPVPLNQIGSYELETLDQMLRAKDWHAEEVSDLIDGFDDISPVLDTVIAADCFRSSPPTSYERSAKDYLDIRPLVLVIRLKAATLAMEGQTSDAVSLLLKLASLGQRMQDAQGSMLDHLFGTSAKASALEDIRRIATGAHIVSSDLLRFNQALRELAPSTESLAGMFKGEFLLFSELMDTAGAKRFPRPNPWPKDDYLKIVR